MTGISTLHVADVAPRDRATVTATAVRCYDIRVER